MPWLVTVTAIGNGCLGFVPLSTTVHHIQTIAIQRFCLWLHPCSRLYNIDYQLLCVFTTPGETTSYWLILNLGLDIIYLHFHHGVKPCLANTAERGRRSVCRRASELFRVKTAGPEIGRNRGRSPLRCEA